MKQEYSHEHKKNPLHEFSESFFSYTHRLKGNLLFFGVLILLIGAVLGTRVFEGQPILHSPISYQTLSLIETATQTPALAFLKSSEGNLYPILLSFFSPSLYLMLGMHLFFVICTAFLFKKLVEYLIIRNFLFLSFKGNKQTLATVISFLFIFNPLFLFYATTLNNYLFHFLLIVLFCLLWIKLIELSTLYSYKEVRDEKSFLERYFSKKKILAIIETQLFDLRTIKTKAFLRIVYVMTLLLSVGISFILLMDALMYGIFIIGLLLLFYLLNRRFYRSAQKTTGKESSQDSFLFKYTEGVSLVAFLCLLFIIILANTVSSPFFLDSLHDVGIYTPQLILEFGGSLGFSVFGLLFILTGLIVSWKSKRTIIPVYLFLFVLVFLMMSQQQLLMLHVLSIAVFFMGLGWYSIYFHSYQITALSNVVRFILMIIIFFTTLSYVFMLSDSMPHKSLIEQLDTFDTYSSGVVFTHPRYTSYIETLTTHTPLIQLLPEGREQIILDEISYSRDMSEINRYFTEYNISYVFISPAMKDRLIWQRGNLGLLFLTSRAEEFTLLYEAQGYQLYNHILLNKN